VIWLNGLVRASKVDIYFLTKGNLMPYTTVQSRVAALNRAFNDADATTTAFAATAAEMTASIIPAADKFDDGKLSDLALSTKVLTNMGILPSTVKEVVALEAALADYFAGPGKGNRGFVVLQLAEIFNDMSATDVFYGAASTAWRAEVAASAAKAPTGGFTTAATDIVAGTALADIFSAAASGLDSANTLNATDSVDGGAGDDTLNLSLATDFTGFSSGSSSNVETISLTNAAPAARIFNAKGIAGATTFAIDANSQNFTLSGLSSIPALKLSNQAGSTARTFDVDFAAASIPSGTSNAMSIQLDKVGRAAVSATATAAAVTVQASTLNLNNIQIANVTTSGATVDVAFGGTLRTINLAGSAATTIASTPTTLTAVDASTATGALTASLTTGGTAGRITSIKGSAGVDKITANIADLAANATITGGLGADTLTLTGSAGGTKQYVMSDVETVTFGVTADMIFSGARETGVTSVTSGSTNTAIVSLVAMGSSPLEFKSSGATVDAGDFNTDTTGNVTVSYSAASATLAAATTADTPLADYTAAEATGVLTVNVGSFIDNTGSTIVADKATSLVINTTSGRTTDTAATQRTVLGGSVDAAKATSIAITSAGLIASSQATAYTVNAAAATTATIKQDADAAFLKLNTAKLQTLDVTSGNSFDLTGSTLTVLASVKADVAKGTFTLPNLVTASSVTVTGAGTATATPSIASLGSLGQVGNTYGLSLTASGLAGGFTATNVTGGAGFTTDINVSGVKANSGTTTAVSLQAIGAATAGAVTLNAAGVTGAVSMTTVDSAGAISVTASPTKTFSIGNVTSASNAGNVDVLLDGTVGAITIGTFTGNTVTVKASDTIGGVKNAVGTVGTYVVSARTGANIEVSSLEASTVTINSSSTSAGLAVALKGGNFVDTVTVNGVSGTTSLVLTGDMGLGTDSITVNGAPYLGTNTQTISVASLNNYDVSSLIGSNGKDVIVGGSGRDTIAGGRGQDTLTGGAGKDVFVFNSGDSSVSAPDTITDFAFGTNGDTITWGSGAIRAGVQANVTGTGITINANSVVTFATTPASLSAAVTAVSTGLASGGDFALFTFGGTSYAFISDGDAAATTNDVVVILTGVVLPTTVLAAGTSTANAATGLTGFGI